jgi:hypothetical protein
VPPSLFRDGQRVARVDTDAFGFRFDGLATASGAHELRIAHPAHGGTRLAVDLAQSSVGVGEVRLGTS